MHELPLSTWESFYVIVGTSAAALIGMQFVVMTLADARGIAKADTIGAFSTPTVTHMSAALIISAYMSAPWQSLSTIPAAALIAGIAGLFYSGFIVVRRARAQRDYTPVWQDWVWYTIMPSICYIALGVSSRLIGGKTEIALFTVGFSALGLLLVGVHNAWDSVTHIVVSSTAHGQQK